MKTYKPLQSNKPIEMWICPSCKCRFTRLIEQGTPKTYCSPMCKLNAVNKKRAIKKALRQRSAQTHAMQRGELNN